MLEHLIIGNIAEYIATGEGSRVYGLEWDELEENFSGDVAATYIVPLQLKEPGNRPRNHTLLEGEKLHKGVIQYDQD